MKCMKCFNLIAGLVLVAFTATGFAANDKLSTKLKDKAQSGGNETVSVIVQYHAMPDTAENDRLAGLEACLLYTSPSPRDGLLSRMPSSA